MEGFGLLVGHLLGDYVLQNDWMARCKTAVDPGPLPTEKNCEGALVPLAALEVRREAWNAKMDDYANAWLACTAHCLLYTLAVWACSYWWMPWWGFGVCFVVHWPIDRFRLAVRWMRTPIARQWEFASDGHPLYPWSIVVVDNTLHLLTLFVIGVMAL